MSPDEHGFRYPHIDRSTCINCGKCERVCPVLNNKPSNPDSIFYGCKHVDDEVRRHSSSGGFFYELARTVVMTGGVVFGAAFSEDYHKVVHVQASTLEELEPIRVSKYVQSEVDSSFPLVNAALGRGQRVLFSGTPCQIAGIKSYVGEVPVNLILAEVVCHGVPSPKVWDVYLSGLEKDHGSKVSFVSFRDKSKSWRKSDFLVLFEDGTEFRQPNSENPYMKAFLKNLSIRPSCTSCKFKRFISGADITMGDFWGSTELGNSYNDNIGISVIALNTEKGHSLFDLIKPGFTGVIEVDEKTAFTFNESFCRSASWNEDSGLFFSLLSDHTFPELVSRFAFDKNDRTGRRPGHIERIIRRLFRIFK